MRAEDLNCIRELVGLPADFIRPEDCLYFEQGFPDDTWGVALDEDEEPRATVIFTA